MNRERRNDGSQVVLCGLYLLTGEPRVIFRLARETADDAIAKLFHNGLFRGHPAKPYYEAVDGVGYLLYALLELDQVIKHPEPALSQKKIVLGDGLQQTRPPFGQLVTIREPSVTSRILFCRKAGATMESHWMRGSTVGHFCWWILAATVSTHPSG